jgi:hypothetical protein
MSTTTKPTKQQLRAYLYERQQSKEPPPSPEEVRRQLGWQLTPGRPAR